MADTIPHRDRRQLVDDTMGGELDTYVTQCRAAGWSWETIARELATELRGRGLQDYTPTTTTVHRWYANTSAAA